jgi:hypothetical protein
MAEGIKKMEYKSFRYKDDKSGRKKCEEMIKTYAAEGWTVHSRTVSKEKYNAGKGCCLGLIFLPLALFGRGKTFIDVVMEREVPTN